MRQYILGGLSIIVVITVLLGVAIYGAPHGDSPECRASAAEIGLQVEHMLVVQPFMATSNGALDAFIKDAFYARTLMAKRLAYGCQLDLEPCSQELRGILILEVNPSKAALSVCQDLLGVSLDVPPDNANDG